jgi:hypothetical protein
MLRDEQMSSANPSPSPIICRVKSTSSSSRGTSSKTETSNELTPKGEKILEERGGGLNQT